MRYLLAWLLTCAVCWGGWYPATNAAAGGAYLGTYDTPNTTNGQGATLIAWIKSSGAKTGYPRIFGEAGAGTASGTWLSLDNADGAKLWVIWSTHPRLYTFSAPEVTNGITCIIWTFTTSGADDRKVYVNGANRTLTDVTGVTAGGAIATTKLYVGLEDNGDVPSGNGYLTGTEVHRVCYIARGISASEAMNISNSGRLEGFPVLVDCWGPQNQSLAPVLVGDIMPSRVPIGTNIIRQINAGGQMTLGQMAEPRRD